MREEDTSTTLEVLTPRLGEKSSRMEYLSQNGGVGWVWSKEAVENVPI